MDDQVVLPLVIGVPDNIDFFGQRLSVSFFFLGSVFYKASQGGALFPSCSKNKSSNIDIH
jgi:hypothetical protein